MTRMKAASKYSHPRTKPPQNHNYSQQQNVIPFAVDFYVVLVSSFFDLNLRKHEICGKKYGKTNRKSFPKPQSTPIMQTEAAGWAVCKSDKLMGRPAWGNDIPSLGIV